jgi:broad specificity phosphatase PhoE
MQFRHHAHTDIVELCLFRHGETDWNKAQRWQGSNDIPLNDTGRSQAQTLSPVLSSFQPELILSSDLSRAHETALLASSGLSIPIRTSAALRECHFGVAEGLTREEIITRFGVDAVRRYISSAPEDLDFCFEGGESKTAHLERVVKYLTVEFQNTSYRRVAVSTHGGVLWRVLGIVKGGRPQIQRIPNCAHFRIDFDRIKGQWHFVA